MNVDKTRTKIVCTIGPASSSEEVLTGMIEEGMDVARINLSHGTHADAREMFDRIRSIDDCIAIMLDLQGPKIRVGEMKEAVTLKTGDEFTLSVEDFVGDGHRVSVSHKELAEDLKVGDIVAINDGTVRLTVKEVKGSEIFTNVVNGGVVSSHKGINVPGIKLSCGIPTEKDLKDLDFAAEVEPDLIALSFVREADDVRRVNEIVEANGPHGVDIISKIEHMLAVKNYEEILEESHGVMIARGDLGIEVPIEDVPILQRDLIRKANVWARPAIVATHMLESMTTETIPTRAEVSDVAHAVFDRSDAVMLSEETAVGHDPVAVVQMMQKIVHKAESRLPDIDPLEITSQKKMIVEIIGNLIYNAVLLIPDKIDGIVTSTRSGFTARWIAKFRPPVEIYAVTNSRRVMRKLRLLWGIYPIFFDKTLNDVDSLVQDSVRAVHAEGLLDDDKDVIFTSGTRLIPGRTNIVGLYHIRDLIRTV